MKSKLNSISFLGALLVTGGLSLIALSQSKANSLGAAGCPSIRGKFTFKQVFGPQRMHPDREFSLDFWGNPKMIVAEYAQKEGATLRAGVPMVRKFKFSNGNVKEMKMNLSCSPCPEEMQDGSGERGCYAIDKFSNGRWASTTYYRMYENQYLLQGTHAPLLGSHQPSWSTQVLYRAL